MGITKRLNYSNVFLFLYLVLFPFGQILRIGVFHPIDIVVAIGALYAVVNKYQKPGFFKYIDNFLFVLFLTWFLSLITYHEVSIFYGLLYFLRLTVYFYFYIYVSGFVRKAKSYKKVVQDSLLYVVVAASVFGWVQYFAFPDIKPFFTWGWDEHLYRLVGTFLDPTFLGLLIVFGLMIAIFNKKMFVAVFLFASLAFTYSRASFLAFLVGLPFVLKIKNKLAMWLSIFILLLITALALPTSKNTSIKLFRDFSAIARLENYKTSISVLKKSPIYGVGYNNMCFAYRKFIGPQSYASHACSGSDSSILLILATTGVVGFVSLVAFLVSLIKSFRKNKIFLAMICALMTHSLFSNSMFYPWVMGFMLVYVATILNYEAED